MLRFVLLRLMAAFPTVLGVVLLTFLLFNVVGGSPASVILGDRASAEALEEFDEARGYNKPLFFGFWAATRALTDSAFHQNPGAWSGVAGARFHAPPTDSRPGWLEVTAPQALRVPLAFRLRPATRYRLELTGEKEAAVTVCLRDSALTETLHEWPVSWRGGQGHRRGSVIFQTSAVGTEPGGLWLQLQGAGFLKLTSVRLRRGVRHRFDSQLAHYFNQLLKFDFGRSHLTNRPVTSMLREGMGPSLGLTIPILTGSLIISLALALGCAAARGGIADRALVLLSVALMSVNYIVWVVAGQYFLAYRQGWFPVWGFASWRHLLLPVAIGMATTFGRDLRFYRTVMLEEMHRLYVRMAQAKGLSHWDILLRHVLPNGMVAVVTNVGISIPYLFAGSLLLESFFGIPGLGRMGIEAIYQADFDVVRALVLLGALLYVATNLLTDLAYAWVDPRIRLQ